MFSRIFKFFAPTEPDRKFRVLGRRYLIPPNKQPVFQSFLVEAPNSYAAARLFDTTYTAWSRLDVSEVES